jgi:hypothetical protein
MKQTLQSDSHILQRFTRCYIRYMIPLTLAFVAVLGWSYALESRSTDDFPPTDAAVVLCIFVLANALCTLLSYRAQRGYVEAVARSQSPRTFRLLRFALVFYMLNLPIALITVYLVAPLAVWIALLSLNGRTLSNLPALPALLLLFFVPHAVLGVLLGRQIHSCLPPRYP